MSSALFFSSLLVLALLLAACASPDSVQAPERLLYSFKGSTMGTYFVVKLVQPADRPLDETTQEELLAKIQDSLERVNRLMSTYLPESELSRFNGAAAGEPFPLSPETVEVFAAAIDMAKRTEGALDITMGPLISAWGFGAGALENPVPPKPLSEDLLAQLLEQIGVEHLTLDAQAQTLIKDRDDLYCDLSSLAKGYAVDQVVETLAEQGHQNVMVEVGGEVRTAGKNLEDRPWRLGIEQPAASLGRVQRIVELDHKALATSGDYRNYREINGVRVSHLLNPATGQPIDHRLASVSVIHDTCMAADALATALMVLGPEKGMALADREDLAVLFLIRDAEQYREQPSRAFAERYMPSGAAAANAS